MELNCEFPGCENDNIDLVKCNTCDKWVCEDCNDIPVAKLKVIMNKCKTVFFICKECESQIGMPSKETTHIEDRRDELVSTLTKVFESKVIDVEKKVTKIIEEKLGEELKVVNEINDTIKKRYDNASVTPEINKTYAKVLEVPMELRKIMKETKNNDRVEENEAEKRAQNFVIHGAEEIGENKEDIEVNDVEYIKDILRKLGVPGQPKEITRLGKRNERRKRPINVISHGVCNTE